MNENRKYPQVLLLGNGINVWKGGLAWSSLLSELCEDEKIIDYLTNSFSKKMPMSMQALLATDDDVIGAINRYTEKAENKGGTNPFFGKITNDEQMEILQRILSIRFDAILTTNYSYELEFASMNIREVNNDSRIRKLAKALNNGAVEQKYLLKSYNEAAFNGYANKVFHIHGEARKKSGIILGADKYARLLSRIIHEADERSNKARASANSESKQSYDSWTDYFISGDVYILGFGYDFAETDLWWLLQRKKNEKADHGKVHYYDIWTDGFNEKIELLKLMDVIPENFDIYLEEGFTGIARKRNSERFNELYLKAIKEIENRVTGNTAEETA